MTIQTYPKKRLSIIIETPFLKRLGALLDERGVAGYTVVPALAGKGKKRNLDTGYAVFRCRNNGPGADRSGRKPRRGNPGRDQRCPQTPDGYCDPV